MERPETPRDAFDPDKHTATMFFKELEKVRAKLARIQKSADGPRGTGVQDDAITEALIQSLVTCAPIPDTHWHHSTS